jgi:hypothetical protein
MSQNPFEIPQQMLDLTEKNIEQAHAMCSQFMDAMTQAMSTWSKAMPSNGMTSGFKVVDRVTKFAKQNVEAPFSLASDLTKAKDIPEVLTLQSRFAQAQMQIYASQAQELGRLMAESVQQPRS